MYIQQSAAAFFLFYGMGGITEARYLSRGYGYLDRVRDALGWLGKISHRHRSLEGLEGPDVYYVYQFSGVSVFLLPLVSVKHRRWAVLGSCRGRFWVEGTWKVEIWSLSIASTPHFTCPLQNLALPIAIRLTGIKNRLSVTSSLRPLCKRENDISDTWPIGTVPGNATLFYGTA